MLLTFLFFRRKPLEVEKFTISPIFNVDSYVAILEDITQHGRKHFAEQSWCNYTALFYSVQNRDGSDSSPCSCTLAIIPTGNCCTMLMSLGSHILPWFSIDFLFWSGLVNEWRYQMPLSGQWKGPPDDVGACPAVALRWRPCLWSPNPFGTYTGSQAIVLCRDVLSGDLGWLWQISSQQ
jgi:hypothetical protein